MILEPNALFSEPFEIDMSGMELLADGDDLSIVLIDNVEVNRPATRAGIQGGDTITAIDNRPATDFTLDQIRKMFMEEGKEYLLTIKRGEKKLESKIKMNRQI